MLTPQEVSERAFQKATFNGYNMSQVDEFLDILTADYSALYSENAVLKSKMKVLADKVEEYRATEDAMRQAFMIAQRRADDLVREAEQKRAALIHEAEGEARQRMESITKEVEAEEFRLQQAKNATAAFVDKLRAIHAKQEEFLDQLGEMCPDAQPQPAPDQVEETVSEIDDNVQRLLNQAMLEATAENLKARQEAEEEPEDLEDTAEFGPVSGGEAEDEDEEDLPPVRGSRINFGELQFGRDYEIK